MGGKIPREQVNVAVTFYTRIREAVDWNLGRDIDYLD